MKFFLVEDSESIRALIRSLIEDYHFTVVGEAAKEIEAIQGVIETQPDVMIVDLNLEAGSGVEVIRQIKKHNPALMIIVFTNQKRSEYKKVHLIISDINMPVMDGITMTRELKKMPLYKFTPVIMLTNEFAKDKEAGVAKAWVVKPFQQDQLLSAVTKLVLP